MEKLHHDNTSAKLPMIPNTIRFESNDLDPGLAELADAGYATQAILLQILRVLKENNNTEPEVIASNEAVAPLVR